ncbi:MAG: HAMP domain-containing histidine kinase [Clostridia bacterium]|nr:HAMP domain-containing histidine kinase [Clostridia bacterium]
MKKLKRKILITAFSALMIVFTITLVLTSIAINIYNMQKADNMNLVIESYDGNVPERKTFEKLDFEDKPLFVEITDESQYRTRYFIVYFDSNNQVTDYNVEHIASVDKTVAKQMTKNVFQKKTKTGYCNNFRYRVTDDNYIIFLDCSEDMERLRSNIQILFAVCMLFTLVIMLVFAMLSNRMIKPFEENNRKQKRFITDASHELKTPLAIISANAEVLEYKNGESEWSKNITFQINRMSTLINELLTLSRLEELDGKTPLAPVNISNAVKEVCSTFDEIFESKNVICSYDIQEDIVINANEEQIRRLVSVLTENASKYVSENGKVAITLHNEKRYVILSVFNSCNIDKDFDNKKLFDRFYRPDSSRTSKTGGHGIGLSIAKEITLLHNGYIKADTKDGGIYFTVNLSNRLKLNSRKHGSRTSV